MVESKSPIKIDTLESLMAPPSGKGSRRKGKELQKQEE